MNKQDEAAQTFEPHRRRLTGLAYRMLGSLSEAEDLVQEAYLRWHAVERDRVDSPRAYLSRTVARLCLDHLKSARARRETYVGPWLPEPIIDETALAPDTASELADDLSIALLMTFERLSRSSVRPSFSMMCSRWSSGTSPKCSIAAKAPAGNWLRAAGPM